MDAGEHWTACKTPGDVRKLVRGLGPGTKLAEMPAKYFAPVMPFLRDETRLQERDRALEWLADKAPRYVMAYLTAIQLGIISKDYRLRVLQNAVDQEAESSMDPSTCDVLRKVRDERR